MPLKINFPAKYYEFQYLMIMPQLQRLLRGLIMLNILKLTTISKFNNAWLCE